ncbi:hypothetical protein KP509_33G024300 [Ceratopteris richardii]|uniref:Ubiquitin carboxyl-terminal hydrolase n=1 Tax=Ceratopteris richardii TaxID=49495 RepID=A0A8T2QN40_CERRI|nr:hypothetical protein KP509_33G024300 [Ceratopteris richardii]
MIDPDGTLLAGNGEMKYPTTPAEEKDAILGMLEASAAGVKEGDKFFLVTFRWWKQWSAYIQQEGRSSNGLEPGPVYCSNSSEESSTIPQRPSTIDNSELVIQLKREDNIELREVLLENHDYILLPEQIWAAFQKWYGGGPPVERKVINTVSVQNDRLAVEVYPLRIQLTVSPNGSQLTVRVSKQDTVGELYQRARELLNLGSDQILLEVQVDGSWPEDDHNSSLENDSKGNELALVISEPSRSSFSIAGGPTGSKNITRTASPDNYFSNSFNSSHGNLDGGLGYCDGGGTKSGPVGLTGLLNLGNTCFMNSAIQCLVHTPQLVDFFLHDYTNEINRQNPLGMKGELAIAFGELLRELWEPGRQPVAPKAFKAKLARFAPQFSGYNQHDSQELLAFLLDGLHEDLNRVKSKPYIESKDMDDRLDEEVAHENWENHKARNDSIIVDICQGQYKSTLVCPVCNKVSITFDPFMYLSLPLPSTATRTLSIKLFSTDGISPPATYTVTVGKQSRCKDVIAALSKVCSLQGDERILLTEGNSILDALSPIREDDQIIAHKLSKSSELAPLLIFTSRRVGEQSVLKKVVRSLGHTLVAPVPNQGFCTGADLLCVFERILRPLRNSMVVSVDGMEDVSHDAHAKYNRTDQDTEMCDNYPDMVNIDSSANAGLQDGDFRVCNGVTHDPQLFELWVSEDRFGTRQARVELDSELPAVFSNPRLNTRIHVAVDWSDLALKKYDVKQLENIPDGPRISSTVKKQRQEAISLYSCLEAFLKEEPLGPEDMWYCPSCKEHRQASKKLDLWRLPDILVVHLKRFSYNRYLKNKLETFVNFPIYDLDLSKYVPQKDAAAMYELYAISNHYGSMGGGHYTAYVKLVKGDCWYDFDDSRVSMVTQNEIKTAAAYVLFYRRVPQESSNGRQSMQD